MRPTLAAAPVLAAGLIAAAHASEAMADHEGNARPREPIVYRVDCDSDGYAFRRCEAPEGVYVWRAALVRQDSATTCTEGQNWGKEPRGVWVDSGCSGEFRLFGRDVGDAAPETLSCGSAQYGRKDCRATDLVFSARLMRQRSSAECVEDRTWGWDQYGVWVDEGCRGDFLLNDPRDAALFDPAAHHGRGPDGHARTRGLRAPTDGPAAEGAPGWGGAHDRHAGVDPTAHEAVAGDPYAVDADLWAARGFDARETATALCARRVMRAAWEDADYSAQFESAPDVTPWRLESASLAATVGDAWRVSGPVVAHNRFGFERFDVTCTVESGRVTAFEARARID